MPAMELLLTKSDHKILSMLSDGKRILQVHAEPEQTKEDKIFVGDIYVGKVRNVVKNINAAFVEFAKGQMGYLSLADKVVPLHTAGGRGDDRVLIGDEIIVQVKREALKTKPPALSGAIDITGRYVVLTIGKKGCNISKKIRDKAVRSRLLEILGEYEDPGYLLIARTNSAVVAEETLREEIEALLKRYEKITQQGIYRQPFQCLEQAPPAYLADIRDGYAEQIERIVTDDEQLYTQAETYLKEYSPQEQDKLVHWDLKDGKLDAVYNVTRTIEHALMPKVWLKSGAYLVIQPTEALISIDVNTGKAVSKKKDVQKTFAKINLEAAGEIAVQMRLRNLSGIILVDFIDLEDKEDQKKLMECLRQEVRKDPVQTTVVDMTKLGLVEITRKKGRKSLYEQIKEIETKQSERQGE